MCVCVCETEGGGRTHTGGEVTHQRRWRLRAPVEARPAGGAVVFPDSFSHLLICFLLIKRLPDKSVFIDDYNDTADERHHRCSQYLNKSAFIVNVAHWNYFLFKRVKTKVLLSEEHQPLIKAFN